MVNIVNYKTDFKNVKLIHDLEEFIQSILVEFDQTDSVINMVFCDNAFIQILNYEYREKDYPTDVLAFSQTEEVEDDLIGNTAIPFESDEEVEAINDAFSDEEWQELGDVIISIDKAVEQSKEYSVSLEEEIGRLAIHGTLHLLGFDHETSKADEKEMLDKQDAYLQVFIQKYMH